MNINIVREKILHKGYANITDIMKFIPCGHPKAKEIFNKIKMDVECQGKTNLDNAVLATRLLPHVGLTEKKVIEFARQEKADAATSTKN